jgi:hypothetical protein
MKSASTLPRGITMAAFLQMFVLLVLAPLATWAHGDGASFEKEIGGYFVDIGYSAAVPSVGDLISFDFDLRKGGSADSPTATYSDVWVRIVKGTKTYFAGGIGNGALGGPRMAYAFPEPGIYTVHSRFEDAQTETANASFTITVGAADGSQSEPGIGWTFYLFPFIAFALGALLVLGVNRFRLR